MDSSPVLPRASSALSSTFSSIDNSTDTTSLSTATVHGPGALSGRALKALGSLVVRASDELTLRRRLASLNRQMVLRSSPLREETDIRGLSCVPLPQEWRDILEWTRRDLYSDDIRRQALEIVCAYMNDARMQEDSLPLMSELLKWPEDEITIFLSELISILPDNRLDKMSRNNLQSSFRNRLAQSFPGRGLTTAFLQCIQTLTATSRKAARATINAGLLDLILLFFSNSQDCPVLVSLLYKMLSLGGDVRGYFASVLNQRGSEDIHIILTSMLYTLKALHANLTSLWLMTSPQNHQDLVLIFLHSYMSVITTVRDPSQMTDLLSKEDFVLFFFNDADIDDKLYHRILDSQSMASTRRKLHIDITKLLWRIAATDSDISIYPSRFLFTSLVLKIVVALWVVRDQVLSDETDATFVVRKTKFPERLLGFLGVLATVFRMKDDITDFTNGLYTLLADLPCLDTCEDEDPVECSSPVIPSISITIDNPSDISGYM